MHGYKLTCKHWPFLGWNDPSEPNWFALVSVQISLTHGDKVEAKTTAARGLATDIEVTLAIQAPVPDVNRRVLPHVKVSVANVIAWVARTRPPIHVALLHLHYWHSKGLWNHYWLYRIKASCLWYFTNDHGCAQHCVTALLTSRSK